MIKPGIYNNLSNDDYHADPAIGSSGLKDLLVNPRRFQFNRQVKKTSPVFDLGTAIHLSILQPDILWDHLAIPPKEVLGKNGARSTNAYKDWALEQPGKIILTPTQYEQMQGVTAAVMAHPDHRVAQALVENESAVCEQSIFWEDERGFMCKARCDIRQPNILAITDLKSAASVSKRKFMLACIDLGYDVSAAFYLAGVNQAFAPDYYQDFFFIAVEKKPPFHVAVYRAPPKMLDAGRRKIRAALDIYTECLEKTAFPDYPDEVQDIEWPDWAD